MGKKIHSQRDWGKYPNEELVRFIGRIFFKISLQNRKNIRVLEVGCGQGANLWFLLKEGFDTHGFDISTSAVFKAKKRLKDCWNVYAHLTIADMLKIPYKDCSFDIVIDCASIQHITYSLHASVYKEIYRVLKLNGYFWHFHVLEGSIGYNTGKLIGYKTFKDIPYGPFAGKGIVTMCSLKDIRTLLLKNGFGNF